MLHPSPDKLVNWPENATPASHDVMPSFVFWCENRSVRIANNSKYIVVDAGPELIWRRMIRWWIIFLTQESDGTIWNLSDCGNTSFINCLVELRGRIDNNTHCVRCPSTMSMRNALSDESLATRLSDKDIFKIKLSLSCLSNRVVVCPSVSNLYMWEQPTRAREPNQWKYVRSGVPVLVVNSGESGARNPKGLSICLVDRESGFATWKEPLSSASSYKEQQKNFHTLTLSGASSTMAGLRFNDELAACNFVKEVEVALQDSVHVTSSPELNKVESSHHSRFRKFRKLKKTEISSPCLFSHVTSITQATPIGAVESGSNSKRRDKDSVKAVNGQLGKPGNIRRAFSMKERKRWNGHGS